MKLILSIIYIALLGFCPALLFSETNATVDSIPPTYLNGLYNSKIPMYKYYVIDTVGVEEMPNHEKRIQIVRSAYTEERMIKLYNKEIYLRDTITEFDYQTYAKTTEVRETRIIEAYFLLIQRELGNDKPDANKIRKWSKKAKIKRKQYNI